MAGAILLSIVFWRNRALCLAAMAFGVFLLATWRNPPVTAQTQLEDVSRYNGAGSLILVGGIQEPPEIRDAAAHLRVAVESVTRDRQEVVAHGSVLVRTSRYCQCTLGDRVRLMGHLEEPPAVEGFDYPRFLAERGIRSVMYSPSIERIGSDGPQQALAVIDGLRRRFAESLAATLPEPHASLAVGLLLGLRADIPRELLDDFNRTGTSHILAISGYNTSLVVIYLMAFVTPIAGRRRAATLALVGVAFFCILTGATPSVVRATIMSGLAVAALLLGRQRDGVLALLVAATLMVAYQPQILRDIGFQLSFAATGALVAFGEFERRLLRTWNDYGAAGPAPWLALPVRAVLEATCVTMLATVATLPLMAYHFGSLPTSGLVANLLLSPVIGPALLASAIEVISGLVWPGLAGVLSGLAWMPLSYMILVVTGCARLPLASIPVSPPPAWALWLFLAGVSLAWAVISRGTRARIVLLLSRLRAPGPGPNVIVPRWVLIALTVGAMLPWSVILTRSDDDLHVFFLDVGQGDAIFIRGRAGKVLIDGGPSPQRILAHLGRLMPFWDRRLDYVVLTHAHADHVTGLVEVLERFEVRGSVEGQSRGDDAVYSRWEELASRSVHQRIQAEPGLRLRLGDQAEITVSYSPDEPLPRSSVNESSVALRLTAPAVTLMLMGDLGADGQANLLTSSKVPTSTILKVPHHGSQDSLNEEFVRMVSPRVSVISVGADNRFGHPAVSTLAVLSRTQILRTDERGTIEVVTNGRSYWLKSER